MASTPAPVFDIHRPLQNADIQAATEYFEPVMGQFKIVSRLALVVFSAALTVILALVIDSQNTGAALALAVALFAAASGFLVWLTHAHEMCRQILVLSTPATMSELADIEELLDQSPLCVQYLRAVSAQGRPLCLLECVNLEKQIAKDIAAAEATNVREAFAQRGIALC